MQNAVNNWGAVRMGDLQLVENPYICDHLPKLHIRDDVPMTDEARQSMNNWLAETFGHYSAAIRIGNLVYVSPQTMGKMRDAISRGGDVRLSTPSAATSMRGNYFATQVVEIKQPVPCGGCGETSASHRCLGCLHNFGETA